MFWAVGRRGPAHEDGLLCDLRCGEELIPVQRMTAALVTAFRILTFRANSDELHALDRRHLALGFFLTWLVGVGRWWEDPRASLLQHFGIGSVIYVFVLALFLWLILLPINPPHRSFLNVLAFVSLTSPPGILYAIPVRHGLDPNTAQGV